MWFACKACKRHVNIFMQRSELITIRKYTQVISYQMSVSDCLEERKMLLILIGCRRFPLKSAQAMSNSKQSSFSWLSLTHGAGPQSCHWWLAANTATNSIGYFTCCSQFLDWNFVCAQRHRQEKHLDIRHDHLGLQGRSWGSYFTLENKNNLEPQG